MTPEPDLSVVPVRRLFGLDVAALTLVEVVHLCQEAIAHRSRLMIGVLNAAKVVNLSHDEVLRTSLLECDLLLPDGQSVVWASSLLGAPLPERTPGIDLFEALLGVAHRHGHRVYFLGARQEVLDRMVEVVAERWPGVVVAGRRDGYFEDHEAPVVAARIRAAEPDMLFLGMTSPKKENFLGRHGESLGVPVLHGVGGSFDVLAGVTRRAPRRWQALGLEWAYRLAQEPRRLWKRYLRTNSAFVAMTVRERVHPHPAYTLGAPASADLAALPATALDPTAPPVTAPEVPPEVATEVAPVAGVEPVVLVRQRRPDQAGLPVPPPVRGENQEIRPTLTTGAADE